ncbi:MAG: hypothetical protein K2I90_11630, partial [Odoribacter sp.]|nr:hypothetical protein [Odoribacter sp.]
MFTDETFVWASYFAPGAISVRCVAGRDTTGCVTITTEAYDTICSNALPYTWRDTTFGVGTESGIYRFQRISTVTGCDSILSLHLTVNECNKPRKGVLYNGVCWAESNVDKPGTFAPTPLSYGMLYQWNSKKGWLATESIPDRNNQASVADHWESANDPCPAGWRIPTIEEAKTLDHCKDCYRTVNDYEGYTYYWSNNTSDTLWIPTFGYEIGHSATVAVSQCGYWSSSANVDDVSKAWMFFPRSDAWPIRDLLAPRDYAFYIRCVAEKHDTVVDVFKTIFAEDLPYEWGDTIFQESTKTGTYRFQQSNCAFTNIIDLHLTVKECTTITNMYDTICANALPYAWRDTTFGVGTESGIYRFQRISTVTGCDSIVNLHLTVHPTSDLHFYGDVCSDNPYNGYGFSLPAVYADTVVRQSFKTAWGCDSVRTLHLTVHQSYDLPFWDEACYGDSYNGYGFSLPAVHADTVVRKSFKTVWGCDSVRTLHLTVWPVRDTIVYDTICKGDGYYRHGFNLPSVTEGFTQTRILQTVHGCDSNVMLHLTVHPAPDLHFYGDVCSGNPYEGNGFSLPAVYADTVVRQSFKTARGCDSIRTLHLTVHQSYDLPFWDEACYGKPYEKNGFSLPAVYADTVVRKSFKTVWGCDSVRTLHLTVWPVRDTTVYDTVCQGDPYYLHGQSLTSAIKSFTESRNLQTVHGCDSTVTLHLTVHPKHLITESRDICEGESVEFRGKRYDRSGTYYDSLKTAAGCDSIYQLVLTVHQPYDLHFYGDVCYGRPYNGNGFSLPAVYADTVVVHSFKTVAWGCDSIRTLYLSVHPLHDTTVYDTVCQGKNYHGHGFSLSDVQTGGEHSLSLSSRFGCDSLVHLCLTMLPSYRLTLYDSICPSDRYDGNGFRLTDVTTGGKYIHYLKTTAGCDSIVTLDLHVYRDYLIPETRNACDGDVVEFRGGLYDRSGVYDDSLQTVHGCDSIYRLTLNVHPVYAVSLTDILCEGVPYTRHGFNVAEQGTHVLHLKTVHGCDSIVTLELTEEKKVSGNIVLSLEDCETHGYAFFFEPDSAMGFWRWDMGDGSTYRTQEGYHTYADSGTYRVTLQLETPNGCGNEYARDQWVPYYAREVAIRTNRTAIDTETPSVRFRAEAPAGTVCRWEFGDGETAEGAETEHVYDATSARYYDAVL